jgi:hypothetical protein
VDSVQKSRRRGSAVAPACNSVTSSMSARGPAVQRTPLEGLPGTSFANFPLLTRLGDPDHGRQTVEWRGRLFGFNGLGRFYGSRRRLQAGMNRNMFGCFDSKSNSISTNFQDGNLDFVGYDDLLIFLTAYDQHLRVTPCISAPISIEKYKAAKNTSFSLLQFCVFKSQPFNFISFSVTICALFK